MATLFNKIFYAIRGLCISDESASVAAAKVAELAVKKFTSTNTGIPKLPTLVECERWYIKEKCGFEHITELEKNVIRDIYNYICRQLRAGA